MSDCGITMFGAVFAVSTTPQNADLDQTAYEGLTYTDVDNLGSHGDTGTSQNIITYSTFGNNTVCKAKGEADAGSPDLEFLDVPGAGLDLMKSYASVTDTNNYAFRITFADGSIEYNRGLVAGSQLMKGGNEDFKRIMFSLALNQEALSVAAP